MARKTSAAQDHDIACRHAIRDVFVGLTNLGVDVSEFYPTYHGRTSSPGETAILHELANYPDKLGLGKRVSASFHREMLRVTMQSLQACFLRNDVSQRYIARVFQIDPGTVSHWFDAVNPTDPGDLRDGLKILARHHGWDEPPEQRRIVSGCSVAISCLRRDVLTAAKHSSSQLTLSPPEFLIINGAHNVDPTIRSEAVIGPLVGQILKEIKREFADLADIERPHVKSIKALLDNWSLWYRLTMLILGRILKSAHPTQNKEV